MLSAYPGSVTLSHSVDIKSVLHWKWSSLRSPMSDLYSRIKDNLLSRFQRWVKMTTRQKNLRWWGQEILVPSYSGVHVALTTQGKGRGRPEPGWPAEVPFLSLVWHSVTLDSTPQSLTFLHSVVSQHLIFLTMWEHDRSTGGQKEGRGWNRKEVQEKDCSLYFSYGGG